MHNKHLAIDVQVFKMLKIFCTSVPGAAVAYQLSLQDCLGGLQKLRTTSAGSHDLC